MVDDTMRSGRSEANAPSGSQLFLQLFVSGFQIDSSMSVYV